MKSWRRNQSILKQRSKEQNHQMLEEVYEFEPVKQKSGVSFVSPVTKSDLAFKKSSIFVPRVANRRIRITNNKIKRGSNVQRQLSPQSRTLCPESKQPRPVAIQVDATQRPNLLTATSTQRGGLL